MSAQRSQDLLAVHEFILARCFHLVKEIFKNQRLHYDEEHWVRCPLPPFDPWPRAVYIESEVESQGRRIAKEFPEVADVMHAEAY
jgi:hypothetical protein